MPLLFGKPIADTILRETAHSIRVGAVTPGLAVVLVGDDPGSEIYVRLKGEAARSIGMHFEVHHFSPETSRAEVQRTIAALNADQAIHGIILQLPLPDGWDTDTFIRMIDASKDADGFHEATLGRYLGGDEASMPVLPQALRELIIAPNIDLRDEASVAIVNSEIFGQVVGYMLRQLRLQVEVIPRLAVPSKQESIARARVVVSVCGEPGLIHLDDLRSDAIVVDAGITRVNDAVVGDVIGNKEQYPGWITPVPGGVGPLTIACLLRRVTELSLSFKKQ